MNTFRFPFMGSAEFGDSLESCTRCVMEIAGTWYQCQAVEVVEKGKTAYGYVVFQKHPCKPAGPAFPTDLVEQLLADLAACVALWPDGPPL